MASAATAQVRVEFEGVYRLFGHAISRNLKWPKVVLRTEDGQIVVLKRAGENSRYAGQIMVTDDRPFGSNKWYGRIERGGSMYATPLLTAGVLALLRRFSEHPAEVAAEYGRLTGYCCFCQAKLTDDRSTTMGYGPICARNWGMPWGEEKRTLAEIAS